MIVIAGSRLYVKFIPQIHPFCLLQCPSANSEQIENVAVSPDDFYLNVCLCHDGVVMMTVFMPYAVFLPDCHVTHLDRQEVFDFGLPDADIIKVVADSEYDRLGVSIFHLVETFLDYFREIELKVVVAVEIAPLMCRTFLYDSLTEGIDAV